jgi:predicted alpha/beta-fold hydrolase
MTMMNIIVKKIGAEWYRQMLFNNRVQQRLSRSRNKRLTNLNSDKSLQGLEIDWHLANTEMGFDNFVEPILDFQPTYAYA